MAENKEAPGATVESLQALVDELTAERDTAVQKLSEQADELAREQGDHQSTKASLANALESLTDAAGIIDGQKATIEEQEATIVKLQTSPAAYPTITVDKVTYEVQVKNFQYKKEEFTLEQLLKDKKLQKELVGKGVGFLVKKEA